MAKKAPEQEEAKDSSLDGVEEQQTEAGIDEGQVYVQEDIEDESDGEDELMGKLTALKDENSSLKDENSSLKDQILRKTADFENYRKRMIREKQDTVKFGNQEILKDLVDVIDNFERALNSSDESKDFDSFYNGISMIEQQFTSMLSSKYNLTKMTDSGEEYNPNCHEALMMEETEDVKVPTVMEIFQTGYMIHDRVLRPAKVKVGKPVQNSAEESDSVKEDESDTASET